MIWLFLSVVLVLAVSSPGFRKFLVYALGAGLGLLVILLISALVRS